MTEETESFIRSDAFECAVQDAWKLTEWAGIESPGSPEMFVRLVAVVRAAEKRGRITGLREASAAAAAWSGNTPKAGTPQSGDFELGWENSALGLWSVLSKKAYELE